MFNNKKNESLDDVEKEKQEIISRVCMPYDVAVVEVQKYISNEYAQTVAEIDSSIVAQEQLKSYIKQYLIEKRIYIDNMPLETAIDNIYSEMAEYSIITPLLERKDIEEININAWNDIQIVEADRTYKYDKSFRSPSHAEDVMRRMLQKNHCGTLDETHQIAKGYLKDNVRLTILYKEIVGATAGAAASIRLVNPKQFVKSDFVENGTCSQEMYDFLTTVFLFGASECFTGETGSGKTTLMADIMRNFPDDKRLITIENDVREFDLVKKTVDDNGNEIIKNNVLHLLAKQQQGISAERQISANDLLVSALTMHPQAICVAEMKDKSAWTAQEASHTGHTVLTTTHAGSTEGVYSRLATLCLQAYTNIPYDVLIRLNCEAFPIAVYQHKFADNVRRVTDIAECIYDNNGYHVNSIFKFITDRTDYDKNGNAHVVGKFVKCGSISKQLEHRLLINGCPQSELLKFAHCNKEEEV